MKKPKKKVISPAPWNLDEDGAVSDSNGTVIVDQVYEQVDSDDTDEMPLSNNKGLITKAPELLKIAKKMIKLQDFNQKDLDKLAKIIKEIEEPGNAPSTVQEPSAE